MSQTIKQQVENFPNKINISESKKSIKDNNSNICKSKNALSKAKNSPAILYKNQNLTTNNYKMLESNNKYLSKDFGSFRMQEESNFLLNSEKLSELKPNIIYEQTNLFKEESCFKTDVKHNVFDQIVDRKENLNIPKDINNFDSAYSNNSVSKKLPCIEINKNTEHKNELSNNSIIFNKDIMSDSISEKSSKFKTHNMYNENILTNEDKELTEKKANIKSKFSGKSTKIFNEKLKNNTFKYEDYTRKHFSFGLIDKNNTAITLKSYNIPNIDSSKILNSSLNNKNCIIETSKFNLTSISDNNSLNSNNIINTLNKRNKIDTQINQNTIKNSRKIKEKPNKHNNIKKKPFTTYNHLFYKKNKIINEKKQSLLKDTISSNNNNKIKSKNNNNNKKSTYYENKKEAELVKKIEKVKKIKDDLSNIEKFNINNKIQVYKAKRLKETFDIIYEKCPRFEDISHIEHYGISNNLKDKIVLPTLNYIKENNLEFNFKNYYIVADMIIDNSIV